MYRSENSGSSPPAKRKFVAINDVNSVLPVRAVDGVRIKQSFHSEPAIHYIMTFESEEEKDDLHFADIKDKIHSSLRFPDGVNCHLYNGFKAALLHLLAEVESLSTGDSGTSVLLIHGVPAVGKSTLAKCLAYYLAVCYGKSFFLSHVHSKAQDDQALTYSTGLYLAGNSCIILDQCNVNAFKLRSFLSLCTDRKTTEPIPVIMFTSGHYPPSNDWLELQKTGELKYKVISMKVDAPAVATMRGCSSNKMISNEELLEVTENYGRMMECVQKLTVYEKTCQVKEGEKTAAELNLKDELKSSIYRNADINFLVQDDQMRHFIWLAWEKHLANFPADENALDKTLAPELVQYFGLLATDRKETRDRGINSLINWLDVAGQCLVEDNNYYEYDPDDFHYVFPSARPLFKFLSGCIADKDTARDKFECILKAYDKLQKDRSNLAYVKGGMFELLIELTCVVKSEESGPLKQLYGMCIFSECDPVIALVQRHETASSVADLCNLASKKPDGGLLRVSTWVVLNVDKKKQFRGYDFAFFSVNYSVTGKPLEVSSFQLLQATVNPFGKTAEKKAIMADVLDEVKQQLKAMQLVKDDQKVVKPYFLCPSGQHSNHNMIALGKNLEAKVVQLAKFPFYL